MSHVHIHGGRGGVHAFDHLPEDVVFRRHHIVGSKHGQVTLHGLDVSFREAFGDHAVVILGANRSSVSLGVEQRVGPQGPPVVPPRLVNLETRRVLGCERHQIELGELLLHHGMQHCLNLRPRQMRSGAVGKHRDIVQDQVELAGQATRRRAAGRPQAYRNMRAAKSIGKHGGGSSAPVVDRLAAKDVESHCERHPVQQ